MLLLQSRCLAYAWQTGPLSALEEHFSGKPLPFGTEHAQKMEGCVSCKTRTHSHCHLALSLIWLQPGSPEAEGVQQGPVCFSENS